MLIQIINILDKENFKNYRQRYNLPESIYGFEKALLIKDIPELLYLKFNHNFKEDTNRSIIVPGNLISFQEFAKQVSNISSELSSLISQSVQNYKKYNALSFSLKNKNFDFRQSYLMGILNVTPDSFSDGGVFAETDAAIKHGIKMFEMGVDIIDVGGETTKPGSDPVPENEELSRVIPVIKGIISKCNDAIISIDTNKSKVAEEAIKAGASIINDISGLTFDPAIADVAKIYDVPIILMHILGTPKTMQQNIQYNDIIEDIYSFLHKQSEYARSFGIKNIIVDPGIGFGKTVTQNFEILKRIDDFKSLGFPILIGLSRKSFIGKSAGLDINNRDFATSLLETISIRNGARIIRTHNIENGLQTKYFNNKILLND